MLAVCWSSQREQIFHKVYDKHIDTETCETIEPQEPRRVPVGHTQADAAEALPTEGGHTTERGIPIMESQPGESCFSTWAATCTKELDW